MLLRSLHRKLLRDLWHLKSQAVAISLVIGCGVATFVMSLSTAASMVQTQARYYERYRFADIFVHVKRAPKSLEARLAEIPGVARVQTRIVSEVNLDVPGMSEPAQGRLVSIPEHGEPRLNALYLRRGRLPQPGTRGEILVNEAFAEAHQLRPGDSFLAILNGKRQRLTVAGVALSPEFVYQIRPGELFPDDKRYGVLWMPESELAAAFDMEGAFNDAVLSLMRGASEPSVIHAIDDLLESYGCTGAYGREDQISHRFVSDELTQLRAMASLPPTIFLLVAAFLLNIVISRLVRTQRDQIAVLKAFGYANREVALHYLSFALVIVVGGVLVGTGAGAWMGRGMTRMYVKFFRFPHFDYSVHPAIIAGAALFAFGAALMGVIWAVRQAAKLPPAEAMRPEPPASFRPTVVERLGLQRFFSQSARMILRQIERQPIKSALSTLGIALAVAVMILGSFSEDLIDFIMKFQFETSQRQNLTVAFIEPSGRSALHALSDMDGVQRVEGFRSVPVRLRFGHQHRLLNLMGLERGRRLLRLMDMDLGEKHLPLDGLMLSDQLAEMLDAKVGDRITVEVLEGKRAITEAKVVGLLREFSGTNAYMEIGALNRLLGEGSLVSGAYLTTDPAANQSIYRELKNAPRVAGVNLKEAMLESFRKTMSENLLRMRLFNIIFASIIAFGVVYNAARIALSERGRELATLRVLGFTRGEISSILLGEVGVLVIAAIPVGLLLGYGMAALAVASLQTRTQRFPLVVESGTFAYAVLVVLVAAIFSALVVRRRLDHLDMVEVLKSRE